jgi:EAL domain-containing protein (putative c-di-GMP-specific phosphodiesterase class I)
VLGVEILARWRCPRAGLLPPARFIAAMEDTPLIDGLTEQLLARALADSHAWRAGPISMALNLAPRTMEDPDLPERLLGLARAHGVAAGRITLELTETAMARHPQLVGECATRLRLRGFRFAIDDFGIGYSSMALLLGLPFTELKIDRSFVTRLAGSRKARTMLEAMIALGERLDMEVVAEGVETLDELAMLRALGCPAAQGYLFAPPLSQAGLVAWLARRATAFPVSSFNDEVSHELS